MASVKSVVRRALLYVPGSSQKMIEKSRSLSVDCIAYDLEDSVSIGKKTEARTLIRRLLDQPRAKSIKEYAVRINSVDSGFALNDLTAVLQAPSLDTIVIPKVNSASDIHFVADVIRHTLSTGSRIESSEGADFRPLHLLALIESAKALSDLPAICKASPYMSGLIFGGEDFALDLSLTRTPAMAEMAYARSAITTACRAYGLPSAIDLVCTSYQGDEGQQKLKEECLGGKGFGFNGKQCIHPSQVEMAQKFFAPSEKEMDWAARIVVAADKAERQGRGAWTLDGQMIDKPVMGKARSIVSKAQACEMDISTSLEKWKDQEPE